MHWDDEVVYQSQRIPLYQAALEKLKQSDLVFSCSCSRKEIANKSYPGTCRNKLLPEQPGYSMRIKTNNLEVGVNDLLQGYYSQMLESETGDFIIKRSDGLFAYHLAVTVDDAEQNITVVVRGIDLLDSTPRQVYLQQLLNYSTPEYLHLPIAIKNDGKKISKQSHAKAIDHNNPCKVLYQALVFLGQTPPIELIDSDTESILNWSIQYWDLSSIPKRQKIKIEYD